jgi:hypothetical protein
VGPGFFDALGLPILAGRDFDGTDDRSVLVSATLAARLWPGRSAVGESLQISAGETRDVVGIVPDIRHARDTEGFYPGIGMAAVYRPFYETALSYPRTTSIVVRCGNRCLDAVPHVRSAVEAAGATVLDVTPLHADIDQQLAPTRLRSDVAAIYATFGLLLALAGVY